MRLMTWRALYIKPYLERGDRCFHVAHSDAHLRACSCDCNVPRCIRRRRSQRRLGLLCQPAPLARVLHSSTSGLI